MEALFFIGVAGSLVVVAWTTVEDFGLFSKSEEKREEYPTSDPTRSQLPQVSSNA